MVRLGTDPSRLACGKRLRVRWTGCGLCAKIPLMA